MHDYSKAFEDVG